MAAHLLDKELGVAFDAQRANIVSLRIVERGDQPEVFRDIVGVLADVLLELGHDFASGIANDDTVGGGAGVSARTSINIGLVRSDALWFGWCVAEQAAAGGRGSAGNGHEPATPSALGFGAAWGIGSRL